MFYAKILSGILLRAIWPAHLILLKNSPQYGTFKHNPRLSFRVKDIKFLTRTKQQLKLYSVHVTPPLKMWREGKRFWNEWHKEFPVFKLQKCELIVKAWRWKNWCYVNESLLLNINKAS
jgi:hypothetical protein